MIETGLNVRAEVRNLYELKLIGTRNNINIDTIPHDLKPIVLSNVKRLFKVTIYGLMLTFVIFSLEYFSTIFSKKYK